MEAEDLSSRELTIDSIMSKVRDIKNKFQNEDLTDELSLNKLSADTTDNSGTVNQIMMANNPEDWLNLLLKLEKNSDHLNDALLNKLIGRYSQAIEALPPDKYGQNESFAQIQVRFAELKAIQEPDDARDYFQMAKANCKKFSFVHISFAQFELSQEKDLQDVLKRCLIRDPKLRISIPELLAHPYVQIQTHPGKQMTNETTEEMKLVLGQLVGLTSPNSILKAAKTLYEHYSSGESHDSSSLSKMFDQKWGKK